MKALAKRFLKQQFFSKAPEESTVMFPSDLTEDEKEICKAVAPYTMTSIERIVALIQATKYVIENGIEGDFVECGVWRGGSMMAVAYTLLRLGDTTRRFYLYDTFMGMSEPSDIDQQFDGVPARQLLSLSPKNTGLWCYADKKDVFANLKSTGYPENNFCLIEGTVEETLPKTLPNCICLLRLDTDWYASTKHELIHLYPKLTKCGILIIDDYGHWSGAKTATDEYFSLLTPKPFLQRIDYTGRLLIKLQEAD